MNLSTRFQSVPLSSPKSDVADELRKGLRSSPKWLPSKWLYDAAGSDLFEQICDLPEYYPTRTESAILQEQTDAILDLCPPEFSLVELGSGSSKKTGHIVREALDRQEELTYFAIDISEAAVEMAAEWMLEEFSNLQVVGIVGEFNAGLDYLREQQDGPQLIAFLGSTIGNMAPEMIRELFTTIRKDMAEDDRFLLGFDLWKDESVLVPAYDDAQGVTAQFNLNTLTRLNTDFGANFNLDQFSHRAELNHEMNRVEMHIVSHQQQTVDIPGLNLKVTFRPDETIHTENSHKFSKAGMQTLLSKSGLSIEKTFTDDDELFCLALIR